MGIVVSNHTACTLVATNASHPTEGAPMIWASGARYGWAIRHQTHLPDGIFFTNGTMVGGAPSKISFNSDGTAPLGPAGDYTVEISERFAASPGHKTITVRGLTGQIKVE
jgi:hypothetical protein